jgi:hypothetical protein
MIVIGGADSAAFRNDCWTLSLEEPLVWHQIYPEGAAPSPRRLATAIYDASQRQVILFGGEDDDSLRNDTWALELDGAGKWKQVAPLGSRPVGRRGHCAIYELTRRRMLMFGGYIRAVFPFSYANDTWVLNLCGVPRWTRLFPPGAPGGRHWSSFIRDPIRDRMVIYAGDGPTSFIGDTWALGGFSRVACPDFEGLGVTKTGSREFLQTPLESSLSRPSPNPFRTTVMVRVLGPGGATSPVDVIDATGRRVRVLDALGLPEADGTVVWDGRDQEGHPVSAGVYFFRLLTGRGVSIQKVIRF